MLKYMLETYYCKNLNWIDSIL